MKLDSRKSSEFLNGFYPSVFATLRPDKSVFATLRPDKSVFATLRPDKSVFATLRPDEPGKPERSRALVAKGPQ